MMIAQSPGDLDSELIGGSNAGKSKQQSRARSF
jgi:hypothetical protein